MKTITLYEDNIIANAKEVSYKDIYQGFKEYPYFKENYKHQSFEHCLNIYISNKDGLSSSLNASSFTDLCLYCLDCFKKDKKSSP